MKKAAFLFLVSGVFLAKANNTVKQTLDENIKIYGIQKQDNKTLVLNAMQELFGKRNISVVDKYWTENYIQHNPNIPNGREPLKSFVKSINKDFKYEPGVVIATGNYVMIQSRYTYSGEAPQIVVDIFRIENEKIAEHWDVIQSEVPADQTPNKNPMFPVSKPKVDNKDNKKLIENYLTDLFIKKDASLAEKYWGTDMKQHNPTMPNGLEVLKGFAAHIPENFKYIPGIAVAEGNTVMIHGYYEGWGPKPLVAVDIFRVENGKVVEHWDVMQEAVPTDKTANGNAMTSQNK